jgi:hypothetical protein
MRLPLSFIGRHMARHAPTWNLRRLRAFSLSDISFPAFSGCPEGGSSDAKSTNSNADGFVLWPLQHAGRASGSSEWLGRRLGGQGDLAARCDLLSASLSPSSLSSLSSLSLVIGLL